MWPVLVRGKDSRSGSGTLESVEKRRNMQVCLCPTLRGEDETQSGSGLLTGHGRKWGGGSENSTAHPADCGRGRGEGLGWDFSEEAPSPEPSPAPSLDTARPCTTALPAQPQELGFKAKRCRRTTLRAWMRVLKRSRTNRIYKDTNIDILWRLPWRSSG